VNTIWSGTFLRGVTAICCIVVIGAAPGSHAFEAPPSVNPETTGTADSALPDAPSASSQVTAEGLPLAILKDQIPSGPVRYEFELMT
jgi:hypothetical protein